jgi:uncharacterized protein (TIGR02996 family)
MQYDDDIAFQRAILANPADTTLKLVYADWLQDRADPRAEYVRIQVRLHTMVNPESAVDAAAWFIQMGDQLDPGWVAFMRTLAHPFEPITFQEGEPGHPFAEAVGSRGHVITFESQYRGADDWNEGLLADLALLSRFEWPDDGDDTGRDFAHSFLCELSPDHDLEPVSAIRRAIKASLGLDHDRFRPAYGPLEVENQGADTMTGWEQQLSDHVIDGRLYRVSRQLPESSLGDWDRLVVITVGRSAHGNRLVGAITSHLRHDLDD